MDMSQSIECRRCHRPLKAASSVNAEGGPIGPVCARRERQDDAVADVKPETLAKAVEDVEDGAIIDTRRVTSAGRRVFAVVSSDGTATYLTTSGGACTCKAGLRGKYLCRHAVAARLVTAA